MKLRLTACVVILGLGTGCAAIPIELEESAAPTTTAGAALQNLVIKGLGPKTGYSRDKFGHAWTDTDRNGCDTRNDILRRDLTSIRTKAGTRGCKVLSGVLADPYTGMKIRFTRGGKSEIDIDHVVALGNAWVSGATGWSSDQRERFANDPINLLAVSSAANRQKGDANAASWLPVRAYRCTYVRRQVTVKATYHLAVTRAEHDVMARILADC